MKFSLNVSTGRSWNEIYAISQFLDSHGWHALYVSDHFMPNGNVVMDGGVLECWSTLSALAGLTSNVMLGSFVSPLSIRHPAVLVNTAGSLNTISSHRCILGVGAGWQVNEHKAYGFDLLSSKDRVKRFKEGIEVIDGLINNQRYSFNGKYFQISNATCQPLHELHQNINPAGLNFPGDSRIPILIGSNGYTMMKYVLLFANMWNIIGGPDVACSLSSYMDNMIEKIPQDHILLYDNNKACRNKEEMYSIFRSAHVGMLLLDDITKPIIKKYDSIPRPQLLGNKENLQEAIKMYRKSRFDEIVLPDMPYFKNLDDLFIILDRIKTELE
jgi:hypothetical protein